MRIITGSLKGRRLKSPKSNDVRPTSDKVKEAIFDMLYPYMQEGFVCMDVFAGTGNMGLEAISRGAKMCYFSDLSRDSMALIKENIKYCEVENQAVLLSGDFKSNIRRVHDKIDIFFVDPPYADKLVPQTLKAISDADNLAEGGVVVCEHAIKDVLPDKLYGFTAIRQRRYGVIGVTIYEKAKAKEE